MVAGWLVLSVFVNNTNRAMRSVWHKWLWLGICLMFALSGACTVAHIARHNWAYITLNKALAADHIKAADRQAKLAHFVDYLHWAQSHNSQILSPQDNSKATMLRSIFIGEYYRSRGNVDRAAWWYRQAIQCEPYPLWQDSLSYAKRDRLLPNGNILITDFGDIERWISEPVNNANVNFESKDGVVCISYQNRSDQRDIAAYSLYPEDGVQLGYHTTLSARVKVEQGSFLTLELKVDGNLERYLNYYEGTGDWETFEFPLTGDVLQAIKLGVSEPSQLAATQLYRVWIDWIQLELASDLN